MLNHINKKSNPCGLHIIDEGFDDVVLHVECAFDVLLHYYDFSRRAVADLHYIDSCVQCLIKDARPRRTQPVAAAHPPYQVPLPVHQFFESLFV